MNRRQITSDAVAVVIPTRDRPELVRRAIRSALAQEYVGKVEVIVVFDGTQPEEFSDVDVPQTCTLQAIPNNRQRGLAGARNTGILAATAPLLAFLDDDDEWEPTKLARQIARWQQTPHAMVVSCNNVLLSQGKRHERQLPSELTFSDFQADRIAAAHTSTFLWRTADLVDGPIGLVDQDLPYAYGEDYDMLLRATTHGPLVSVAEFLVTVHWDRPSFFTGKWQAVAGGLPYLLEQHPQLTKNRRNYSHMCGQIAFAYAALGELPEARQWALKSLKRYPLEPRAYAALATALKLVPVEKVVAAVNARGRGL